MTATRGLLAAAGALLGLYGAWLLTSRSDADQLASTAVWLASGVLLHDVVLAPVVVLLGVVTARVLPGAARAHLAVVVVVLGSLTLLSLPVLLGREPANPTLLDRDYTSGWLLVASLVVVAVGCGTLVLERRRRGPGTGGR